MSEEINTINDCLVGVRGNDIVLLRPLQVMDKATALRLAAWIVALTDYDDQFPKILEAVKNT